MNNFQKPNRIEKLEERLYSPNQSTDPKERKHLIQKEYEVAQDWPTQNLSTEGIEYTPQDNKPNWFFRSFIVALIFFIGTAIYLGVNWYLNSSVDASNVDILINSPLSASGGEAFNFEASIQNKNQMVMKNVEIEVFFPDGTRSLIDISKEQNRLYEKIDTLQIGEIIKRNHNAILFGEENEKKEISILLTYQIDESTQLYKKEKKFDVTISSTPVRLTITNVKEITSGQELAFTLEVVSNSTQVLKDVLIEAVYPFGFSYTGSTRTPQADKKTWIISSLEPKETVTFTMRGIIDGQSKDDKFFKFLVGLKDENSNKAQLVFTSKDTLVALTRPFLELDFAINKNNAPIIAVDSNDVSDALISFKNNTDSQLRNIAIKLAIEGSAFSKESVNVSGGFYQSLSDTILWNQNTLQDLGAIAPGKSDVLSFNFRPLGSSANTILVNPELNLAINVTANRNVEGQVSDVIEHSIFRKIRVNTDVNVLSKSLYYTSPISNVGPIPPKVEQKTTYTPVLTIKNTSNTVNNAVITMKVPEYVRYEEAFLPSSEKASYDPVTRILTWTIGTIPAKTGFGQNKAKELFLKTSIIPSISQINTTPTLLDDIVFTGTDSYTNKNIQITVSSITTSIEDRRDYYEGAVTR